MPIKPKFEITYGENGEFSSYLYLREDGENAKVKKNIRLSDLVGAYNGPEIIIDFGDKNNILGIEILDDE